MRWPKKTEGIAGKRKSVRGSEDGKGRCGEEEELNLSRRENGIAFMGHATDASVLAALSKK